MSFIDNLAKSITNNQIGKKSFVTPKSPAPTNQKVATKTATSPMVYAPTFTPKKVSTTTISNDNKIKEVPKIIETTKKYAETGITSDKDGNKVYANGTIVQTEPDYDPATGMLTDAGKKKGLQEVNGKTPTSETTSKGGYIGETYYPPGSEIPKDKKGKPMSLSDESPGNQQIMENLMQLKASTDSHTASIIDNIHNQFTQLIAEQRQTNAGAQGIVNNALLMGGATGQGSSAQYAPISSAGIMQAQTSYGLRQIADLQTKEASLIIQAQQAGNEDNFKIMEQINKQIATVRKEKVDAATKLNDILLEQSQKLAEEKKQSDLDKAIAAEFASGLTDTASILNSLTKKGVVATAEQIDGTLGTISKNVGGVDTSKMSGDAAIFFELKRANQLPKNILALPDTSSQLMAWLKQKTAADSVKSIGSGGSGGSGSSTIDSTGLDSNSGSILAQTGLSLPAFSYLTQGTTALTRMNEGARRQYMQEAENWANKNGIDVSTFKTRYESFNEVLQNNIERQGNTQTMELELLGTVENVIEAADKKEFGKLKVKNLAKLFAGEQLNDPITLKYQTHLNQLRAEMAGYNAATMGRTSPIQQDYEEAERLIKNGVSAGSLEGFKNAIKSSVEKMQIALDKRTAEANKKVWELFGVGQNYGKSSLGGSAPEDYINTPPPADDGTNGTTYDPTVWKKAK